MDNPFAEMIPLRFPERAPKAPGLPDRCVPLAETFAKIPEIRERYGITRVGDTTYLDRTRIPTYCAIVPDSPDLLSVYSGKGATPEASQLSAVMEAVERQAAAKIELAQAQMKVRDILEYVDLRAMGLLEAALDLTTPCVAATNLIDASVVPLPLALVQCPWFGEKLFDVISSNGIASGNNVVEAAYHALTEVIERHVWSMFYVRSQLVPRFFLGPGASDVAVAKEIARPTGYARIDAMIRCIESAGLQLRLFALQEPPLPPVVLASVVENGSEPPMAHYGLGCSLSSAHAIERALTECIQSRVVDIQAAREDIMRPDEPEGIFPPHARRQNTLPAGRWYYDLPASHVRATDLPELMSDDLAHDLRLVLRAVADYGVTHVFAVTIASREQCVVRVVIPLMEKTSIDGTIGLLARRAFNPFYVRS